MLTSLAQGSLEAHVHKIKNVSGQVSAQWPGQSGERQPVHSVYGGAQLFRHDTISRLGHLAVASFQTYAVDAMSFGALLGIPDEFRDTVFGRIAERLVRDAIEDYRIDFEDGYGYRSDADEDDHAVKAAVETARALADDSLSPFFGIRIKPLSAEVCSRSLRTLDLYLTSLCAETGGRLPDNFVVTLPKVMSSEQITVFAAVLDELESKLGLGAGSIRLEIMVETTQSLIGPEGVAALPSIVAAGQGRIRGAHFGAYDYTAACGITSAHQDMLHPACDFARNLMQVSLCGTGVWLADGATNIMPIGPHRGTDLTREQTAENTLVVHRAWKLHYDHCRYSLANGFYQGWDLHPAQIPTRYAAVYAFFLEGIDDAAARLTNFIDAAARSTLIGDVFDDAATGQGLLNYFLRAVRCGALTHAEAARLTGLTLDELLSASFVKILTDRRH